VGISKLSQQSPGNRIVPTVKSVLRTHCAAGGRASKSAIQKQMASTIEFNPRVIERSWSQYNDDWAEKQCEAYVIWLNHVFQGPDVMSECEHSHRPEAITLRTILVHRRRAQANQRAQQCFNGPEMQWMKHSIENEVYSKRLSIRSDHDVFANVSLRSQMISLLMSYSIPWLRLGLETIFGEVICVDDVVKSLEERARVRESLGIEAEPHKKVRECALYSL